MPQTVPVADLEDLAARAFQRAGADAAIAARVAQALVAAERDGQAGHGLSRMPSYAGQVESGKVDGRALPQVAFPAPGLMRVDARHGFAFPAIDAAIDALIPAARAQGIACATLHRSHHAGQLGPHVERLADAGLVAIMMANTPAAMAPWGGKTGLLGTNPIAFAAPRAGAIPLVIDLSLSAVARGKIMAAKRNGTPIPEGIALDAAGAPTTDPEAALAGTMVPAGGAKGAALALMVEVMAAALTGANLAGEASSLFDAAGDPPGLGQVIIAIDPGAASGGAYAATLERLAAAIEADDGARLPGANRMAKRARTEIEVGDAALADLRALAGD
ncbi:Ldh family oxidoreductase [Jannaschia ovalis]|uniref:Ldh family oxidoreductase n=1 Tax=Jannaschia ovalis TaxID=3038773 RepID=A0ABY8LB95_9RHOB|nr:Ldh family oxidoreductase [Jannaschia sp. GRR-S6-38]WGH78546.1 Ldh family oxidoreductase [Jannaschia sp. GRR-S6-38]